MDAQLLNYLSDYAERGHMMFVGSAGTPGPTRTSKLNGRLFSRFLLAVALRSLNFPTSAKGERFAYTEGKGDRGLDGVAIRLGRSLRFDTSELENIVKANRTEQPHILFVQAKLLNEDTDQRVEKNDVENFGMSVLTFLTIEPDEYCKTASNDKVTQLHQVYHALKSAYASIGREFRPIIYMLFGVSRSYLHYSGPAQAHEYSHRFVRSQIPLARVSPLIWGDDEIITNLHNIGIRTEVTLKSARLLPIAAGPAEAAYLGTVSAEALVDALSGEIAGEKQLLEPFFSDNPRAVLEANEDTSPGAYGIRKMLHRNEADRLVLGHNGIVMTARKVTTNGDTAVVSDPQIVNGAQSCHAFFDLKGKLKKALVPIKIIVTSDARVRDDVIIASNSQALIDTADVLACRETVRALQRDFDNVSWREPRRLWLQRRRNEALQYPDGEVDVARTMRPKDLALCFASTFWAQPHTVHADPKWALNCARDGKIFCDEHDPAIYWALGWLIASGRQWGRRQNPSYDWQVDGGPRAYGAKYQWLNALWRIVDDRPDETDTEFLQLGGSVKDRFDRVVTRLVDPARSRELADCALQAVSAGRAVAEPRTKKCTEEISRQADLWREKRQSEGF